MVLRSTHVTGYIHPPGSIGPRRFDAEHNEQPCTRKYFQIFEPQFKPINKIYLMKIIKVKLSAYF